MAVTVDQLLNSLREQHGNEFTWNAAMNVYLRLNDDARADILWRALKALEQRGTITRLENQPQTLWRIN